MKSNVLIFAGIAVILGVFSAAQPSFSQTIPIHAWWSIPADFTSDERYRDLAEDGFTTSMSPFPNADAVAKALDCAKKAGVKIFIACPELEKDPEGTVKRFMHHPALAGFHLQDEPSAKDFPRLAAWAKRIQAVDKAHPCYINLFPTYANEQQLGTATYQAHVDSFVASVPVPFLSFDHYPIMSSGVRTDWYKNLEIISAAARKTGKPFWAFALSIPHYSYPQPTTAQLRLQIFSDLAYGAQGIQYFTYWTPPGTEKPAPVDSTGARTETYDLVKNVNAEIQRMAGVFLGAKVVSVGHTGATIPQGTKRFKPFAPFIDVKTPNGGAVVSRLTKNGKNWLVVVNRDYTSEMPITISFKKGAKITRVGTNGGTLAIGADTVTGSVPPGDMAVFAVGK